MRSSRPVSQIVEFHPAPLQLVREPRAEALPPNPFVVDGVRLLYLGTTRRRVEGEATGFIYFVDGSRRDLDVAPADLPSVLKNRAFVLAY